MIIVRAASLLEEKASLVACPKLDSDAIPGLSETLGQNGVTSNYRYDLPPTILPRVY